MPSRDRRAPPATFNRRLDRSTSSPRAPGGSLAGPRAWVVLVAAWTTVVYIPIAHWALAFQGGSGGWIGDRLGALDFAGGTAVEINSGFSSLAPALVVGARVGFRRDPMRPHNLPLVLLGAGLLWFGWFGFNAGSALSAGQLAGTAMINTQIATAAASLSWVVVDGFATGGRPRWASRPARSLGRWPSPPVADSSHR